MQKDLGPKSLREAFSTIAKALGEDKNTVRLKPEEWNILVAKIKKGELKKV